MSQKRRIIAYYFLPMTTANIGVQTADQIRTHRRDFATNYKRLDLTFLSKGQLRRRYEDLEKEFVKLKQEKDIKKETVQPNESGLEFTEANFNKLIYRVLELELQRTKDLEELGQQKTKIIDLYSLVNGQNEQYSPLMKAV